MRRWSDRFEATWKLYIPLWDVDEGYTKPKYAVQAAMLAAFRVVESPVMALVRKVVKAP